MRILLTLMALITFDLNADGHAADEPVDNGYMLLSTYEISPGQNPAELEKELVQLQLDQESYGFNNCGLYRHWYGGQRAFYAYCFFTDFDQLKRFVSNQMQMMIAWQLLKIILATPIIFCMFKKPI